MELVEHDFISFFYCNLELLIGNTESFILLKDLEIFFKMPQISSQYQHYIIQDKMLINTAALSTAL